MENQNIENTLKKMGIVLEKLVEKIDALEKRVAKLEEKNETNAKNVQDLAKPTSQNTFASGFLGSMAGSMAGMGLYNLLFNNHVSANEFGESLGLGRDELNEILQNDFNQIDNKLDEIDDKLAQIDEKIEGISNDLNEDAMDSDYFESYEGEVNDTDFEGGFDDFEGLEDFEM